MQEEIDPLSKIAAEMDLMDNKLGKASLEPEEIKSYTKMESWNSRKAAILSKYTTSEKLTMVTSFLFDGEKVMVRAQSTAIDKVQLRLEQLDYFEDGVQQKLDLSQSEYINRIEQLNKELVSAWNSEQRVKALKIAIQCAKMLTDTDVLPFYPSKFVLITDILDTFGNLVYDRLRTKAVYFKPGSKIATPLPDDFTPDMVPDTVKETCLNWFYKVASIRELVPRLYVEMALLKSYSFISSNECLEALYRLTDMIQGIGNPLVAVYTRCYLCRMAISIIGENCDINLLTKNFESFLNTYQHIFGGSVKAELNKQKIKIPTYMTLYTPALDFILEAVVSNSSENIISDLLNKCKHYCNSSLILNTIMSGFKPMYISERALQFLDMITGCTDDAIPLHSLLRTLGLCLSVCPPPSDQRKSLLIHVWRNIGQLNNTNEYMTCVEVWTPLIALHLSLKELNQAFGNIINHLSVKRSYEHFQVELKNIVQKVASYISDLESLLALDNFLSLINLFHEESVKVEVCKFVLTTSVIDHQISDPVITNSLMYLGSVLHDSVDALTPEDEHRQIGDILCNIVRKIDYGRDLEQQLDFYAEARGAFANIDSVLSQLVQCVNTLTVKTRLIVKGRHTRKTSDFVRACAAYSFITIPSIVSAKTRLKLYLLSGQVALFNNCLGQGDACFKAALSIIPELESSAQSDTFLIAFVRQFLSTLIVVPDNPERGILSLTRMLLNILKNYEWNKPNWSLALIYINVIEMFSTMTQDVYPYHVDRVESNDALYGSDPKYIQEIDAMISIVITEILNIMKELGTCTKQAQLAIELFLQICVRSDLTFNSISILALNVWNLSLRSGYIDLKYLDRTKRYLHKFAQETENIGLQQLLQKL
ncbi:VPS35 endosomal protein-sorting factor-like isoform X2 [Cylas formicarius]|nr:VPS35 endosomal protein-sorting factor-like isoform X2 [Cylas formicarius]